MPDRQLERVARWTPLLILAYFATQLLIRIALSANLETDEAELVGYASLTFATGNGHPPLYNWLVALVHPLTGGHWAASLAIVKNALLAGSYLLAFDIMKRLTGRALPGLLTVAAFLLVPQIVWKSQITLTHSVLVTFAVIAVLHAIVLIVERGGAASFIWLGVAIAAGGLAKFNFFLALLGLAIAAATIPAIATKLYDVRLALSAAVFAVIFGPFALWSLTHLTELTRRMEKLEDTDKSTTSLDIPGLGLDGFLTLVTSAVAWAAPLAAIWFIIWHFSRSEAQPEARTPLIEDFRRLVGRAMLIGLVIFACVLLAGDLHATQERYLTPLMIFLPFWLVLAFPLETRPGAARRLVQISGAVALAMVTAWPVWALVGREQLFFPYRDLAETLGRDLPPSASILPTRRRIAANLSLYMPPFAPWSQDAQPDTVALIWHTDAGAPPAGLTAQLGDQYRPVAPPVVLKRPYTNFSRAQGVVSYQIYRKSGGIR